MGVRQCLNKYSCAVSILASAVLFLSLGWIAYQSRFFLIESSSAPDVWFYDMGSGKLFVVKSTRIPPIEAPSGPMANGHAAGVRARVFSCGDCSDRSERFIGWLEKHTPEAKQAMVHQQTDDGSPEPQSNITYLQGLLVRSVDGYYWVEADSDEGRQIMQVSRKRCPNGTVPHSCFPGSR